MAYKQAVDAKDALNFKCIVRDRPSQKHTSYIFTDVIEDDTISPDDEKQFAEEHAQLLAKNIIKSLANNIKYKMKTSKNPSGSEISIQIYLPLYEKNTETPEFKVPKTFDIIVNGNEYKFTWADVLINKDTEDKFNRSPLIVELNKEFMKENNNELFIIDKSLKNFENNASKNKEQFLLEHYFYIYLMTREGSSRFNKDKSGQFINKIDCLVSSSTRAAGGDEITLPKKILQKPTESHYSKSTETPYSIPDSDRLISKFEEPTDKYEIIYYIGTILATLSAVSIYKFKCALLSTHDEMTCETIESEDITKKYENIYYITTILATMSISQVNHYKSSLLSKRDTPKDFITETSAKIDTYKSYLVALKSEIPEEKGETSLDI